MGSNASQPLTLCIVVFGIVVSLKLLLLAGGGYRSTDFEVHRNWLAITYSQPVSRWYFETTSEWTLDYPPFFAWFERLLAVVAAKVDPLMVRVENLGYDSQATVYFQRLSVIAVDAMLALGVACCLWNRKVNPRKVLVGAVLVLMNAGLLLVDHVHFQYNGMLLGILLISCGFMIQGKYVVASVVFASLLMLKHLFLALAPLYFVYLLRRFCVGPPNSPNSTIVFLTNLFKLGSVVLTVFAAAFLPFCSSSASVCKAQLGQIAARLFPFGRGLVHAYWAPNVWALYLFLDRLALTTFKIAGVETPAVTAGAPSTTGGLVHDVGSAILPAIRPSFALSLTVLACTPALVLAWKHPYPKVFLWGVVYCAMTSFMLGWHVHEKAILTAIIPLGILACDDKHAGQLYLRMCAFGHFALFPLLPDPSDVVTKGSLYISHLLWSSWALSVCHGTIKGLTAWEKSGIAALAALFVFTEIAHPALSHGRMPFLPLMLTSVACAVGLMVCWVQVLLRMAHVAVPTKGSDDKGD